MSDFISDNLGWIIAAIIVVIILLLFSGYKACDDKKQTLIKECITSGVANFECQAKFQSYCKSSTTVMPMPVIIGK